MEETLRVLALRLGEALSARGWLLGCAESCTGGLLSSVLTDAPGASAWFAGAVVAYANGIKRDVLGVSQTILEAKGAVSREAVLAMATIMPVMIIPIMTMAGTGMRTTTRITTI